jgi:hypothetical protein
MPHPLSALGSFHTVLSLIPVVAGLIAFASAGRIDPATRVGKAYWFGMIASVVTSVGLSSTGGLNPGHALGLLALTVMLIATLAPRLAFLGRAAAYVHVALMSFSFMLLMVPGTNETLSRLPPAHPIGNGPGSAPVQAALAVMVSVFLLGTAYQLVQVRRRSGRAGLLGATTARSEPRSL